MCERSTSMSVSSKRVFLLSALLVNRYADGAAQLALETGHFAGVNLGAVFTAMAAHATFLEILRRDQAKRFFPLVLGHRTKRLPPPLSRPRQQTPDPRS